MAVPLLNHNQARHLSSVLALLLDELSELAAGLPPEPWAEQARAQIHDVGLRVRQLLQTLNLRLPERARPRQRLLAYSNAWLARLHDLRAANLRGYGSVAEGLARELDPALDDVSRGLERLARLAAKSADA